jgi:hypothetical protein
MILVVSLLFACLFSPRFIFSAWGSVFLVAILCNVLRSRNLLPQIRNGAVWASVTMLMTIGLHTLWTEIWPSFELRRLREMRAEFPLVNIADRIERLGRAPESSASLSTEGSQLQQRLQTAYEQQSTRLPFHSLKLVHDVQFERFVRSPGFGPVRMNPRLLRFWAKPTSADPFDAARSGMSSVYFDADVDYRATFSDLSSEPSDAAKQLTPADSHAWTFWDFLHPTTLGEALRPQELVGFRAHRVTFPQPVLFESKQFDLEPIPKLQPIGR